MCHLKALCGYYQALRHVFWFPCLNIRINDQGGRGRGGPVLRFSLENENILYCMPIYESVLIKRKYFFIYEKQA